MTRFLKSRAVYDDDGLVLAARLIDGFGDRRPAIDQRIIPIEDHGARRVWSRSLDAR